MCSVSQSCPTRCRPIDYSPPGSFVNGILKARIREWVAISYSSIIANRSFKKFLIPKYYYFIQIHACTILLIFSEFWNSVYLYNNLMWLSHRKAFLVYDRIHFLLLKKEFITFAVKNWTWNNRLVPNRKRRISGLYIVTLLI